MENNLYVGTGPDLSALLKDVGQIVDVDDRLHLGNPCSHGWLSDNGNSWKDITSSLPLHFSYFNNRLCAYTGKDVVQSTNGGESWENIPVDTNEHTFGLIGKGHARGYRLLKPLRELVGLQSVAEHSTLNTNENFSDGDPVIRNGQIPDY